jgi:hypothetical protein
MFMSVSLSLVVFYGTRLYEKAARGVCNTAPEESVSASGHVVGLRERGKFLMIKI